MTATSLRGLKKTTASEAAMLTKIAGPPHALQRVQPAPQNQMFRFLKRLFPERIFRRKLEPAAEQRLRLAQARAEESTVRTHVDNALMFVDTLAEDLTFDRAIDAYIREMSIPEPLASVVATRTLVVLGADLVPYRRRAVAGDDAKENRGIEAERPKLRLNDASQGRQHDIKRTESRGVSASRAD